KAIDAEFETKDIEKRAADSVPAAEETPALESQPPVDTTVDRRTDVEKRQAVEAALQRVEAGKGSPEDHALVRKALYTSDKVDAPNKRAYDVAPKKSVQAYSDADGLKAFNDKFGYDKGDLLLQAKADALKAAGLESYH